MTVTNVQYTQLIERSTIAISGEEAYEFLQGIVTNDVQLLKRHPVLFSAMLSAQGKVLHSFFLRRQGDNTILLDLPVEQEDKLLKKLKLYRLRSKVEIQDCSHQWNYYALWGKGLSQTTVPEATILHPDPRLRELGLRAWHPVGTPWRLTDAKPAPFEAYNLHRLQCGVPDELLDIAPRNIAAEVGYEQLHAISFDKGCYVGQEVTARAHYRNVLRKCLYHIKTRDKQMELPASDTPILAGDKEIGLMRSHQGSLGLTQCRIADVQRAQEEQLPITAGDQPVTLTLPAYMEEKVASLTNDATQ